MTRGVVDRTFAGANSALPVPIERARTAVLLVQSRIRNRGRGGISLGQFSDQAVVRVVGRAAAKLPETRHVRSRWRRVHPPCNAMAEAGGSNVPVITRRASCCFEARRQPQIGSRTRTSPVSLDAPGWGPGCGRHDCPGKSSHGKSRAILISLARFQKPLGNGARLGAGSDWLSASLPQGFAHIRATWCSYLYRLDDSENNH